MSLLHKALTIVSHRSRIVAATLLVVTLAVGAGATAVDDDTSLDQFETDSVEAEKLAYVEEHFGTDDNTTAVQILVRGENVLSRDSLIATLELQRELREDETISGTLADDPFADLAAVVARAAAVDDRRTTLDERRARLENESAQLENESTQLEAEFAQLEQARADLSADRQALRELAGSLSDALNETRTIQTAYDDGNLSEQERDQGIDAVANATRSNLTEEQYAAFEPLVEEARATQAEMNDARDRYEAGEINETEFQAEMAALEDEVAATYAAIEGEVLAEAFADLEGRGADLEATAAELSDRQADLENRSADLEARSAQLAADYEALAEIDPSPGEAIAQLESMNESAVENRVAETLGEDAPDEVYAFLPTDFEPGETSADARMLFVTQETADRTGMEGDAPDRIQKSQLAMAAIVDERFDDAFVFGAGIIADEMDRSLADSLAIVLPLALLFVTLVLTIAYRDLLDIALGVAGIGVVLVWTFGFMGWTGISFNVVMIAVPVLLVGLSIDYAIHVFMRHREHRNGEHESTRHAMTVALSGVGVALLWVTATAVIGFLSNAISPVGPIRDFGITSAFGIAAALLIFGVLVPALKVETDALLEARGWDRRKRAFGTGGGVFTALLSVGQRAGGRVPWVVVVLALVVTGVGAIGASQLDTSFEQEDFIADDPPDWTKDLPGPFATGDYGAKANLEYVNDNFLRQDAQGQVLVEGAVTDDHALERIDRATREASEKDTVIVLPDGSADVTSPLSVMERVAERNETFNQTYTGADTDGDGVPDENLTAVYDALFAADETAAAEVVHRTDDGEYAAVRMVASVEGGAPAGEVTDDVRALAATVDGDGLEATATGQLVVFNIIENDLFDTVVESLLITLVAVFAFLMLVYRLLHGSALLGAVTLLPIVFAVAWILGTMYVLGISFNVMTGTITSLTVGLGIAYNIHMSERYVLERKRGRDLAEALHVAVTGTGGALLGSAATTIGGFGVLTFAILPPLQQFGLITGTTILYAFLGSVFVLPSMLVLWSRHLAPPPFAADG